MLCSVPSDGRCSIGIEGLQERDAWSPTKALLASILDRMGMQVFMLASAWNAYHNVKLMYSQHTRGDTGCSQIAALTQQKIQTYDKCKERPEGFQ
eukprot:1156508-Pelagomonas_calceolata.AAC.4